MNYTKSTNFATKDSLPSGDPQKLIKGTEINAEFDAISSAISSKQETLPTGLIVLWSGATTTVPTGWALCNGLNGTPDLRDRFVVGAAGAYVVGATGGSKDAVVVAHSHTASTGSAGAHSHSIDGASVAVTNNSTGSEGVFQGNPPTADKWNTKSSGAHTHSVTVNSTGESGTDKNLPPYYALAYIMKL